MGNENLGIFSHAQSIVNYFFSLVNIYSQRDIAYYKDNKHQQSVVFAEVLIARIVTVLLSMIACWVVIVRTADYPLYDPVFGLEFLAALFDISWFLQGNENFRSQMIRTMIIRILGAACIFLLVKEKSDLYL